MNKQQLYYGDNLDIMRRHIPDESVDLCYIDPPFNSKRDYNQIYNNIGTEDKAQSMAFVDTWEWHPLRSEKEYDEICLNQNGIFTKQTSDLIIGLEKILGKGSMLAYLVAMTLRINEIYRVLKPTGSFYLHCDPTASHYLKLLLDAVFCGQGGEFVNEITWKRSTAKGDAKQGAKHFGRITDTIFFYVKNYKSYTWTPQYTPYSEEAIKRDYRYIEPETNKVYRLAPVDGPGGASKGNPYYEFLGVSGYWRFSKEKMQLMYEQGLIVKSKTGKSLSQKMYLDEAKGRQLDTFWGDINKIAPNSKEHLSYPTQKPEALLERIIKASSNEGDVVLDAFCGCGTTVAVAQRLGRQWIGIDITYQSIALILKRLADAHGNDILNDITVNGIPKDIESAKALALKKDDRLRKEFEKWAVMTYSDNRAMINNKKGKDYGIDGILRIRESIDKYRDVLFSVKSGKVNSPMVRDFRGTIERENAAAGIFITLSEPSKDMMHEAAVAGSYGNEYMSDIEKIKIVTIEQILKGERLSGIPLVADALKKAGQATNDEQINLF